MNMFLSVLLGLSLGSFFNVIISRIHNEKSLWKGRSQCENCNYTLKWYDLIPLISYLAFCGKCRNCKAKIPPIHFYSEIVMGIGLGVVVAVAPSASIFQIFITFITVLVLGFCAISDTAYGEIYTLITDITSIFLLLLNVYALVKNSQYELLIKSLLGYIVIITLFLIIAKIDKEKHLGYGDYHLLSLMALSGLFINIPFAIFIGCFIGLIIIFPRYYKKSKEAESNANMVALAPFLYYGYLTTLLIKFGGLL